MTYELWNVAIGHRIGGFDNVDDLAEAVAEIAAGDGPDAVNELAAEVWATRGRRPFAVVGPAELRRLAEPTTVNQLFSALGASVESAKRETRSTGQVVAARVA